MSTDYTNLNKVFPKDAYPLSSIDRLVDGATDHRVLSFLYVYFGYNHICMHLRDKEKTTFMTNNANYSMNSCPLD